MYIPFDRPKKLHQKNFQNLRLAKKQHVKTISKLNREKYVKRASIVILSTQLVLKYKKTHALFTYNSKQVVKNFQKAKKRWFQNNWAVPLPLNWTPRLNKTTTSFFVSIFYSALRPFLVLSLQYEWKIMDCSIGNSVREYDHQCSGCKVRHIIVNAVQTNRKRGSESSRTKKDIFGPWRAPACNHS